MEEALRLGYAMIDTSGDYGTQPGIGLDALNRLNEFYSALGPSLQHL